MKTNEGVFDGLRMLSRNRLMVKLTVCVMLTGIVMEGMYELLGQYFQLKLGYNTADQVSRGSPCMNLIWLPWYCVRLTLSACLACMAFSHFNSHAWSAAHCRHLCRCAMKA